MIKKTLEWYGEMAEALSRYQAEQKGEPQLAILTSLGLDGGARAAAAIKRVEGKEQTMLELMAENKRLKTALLNVGIAIVEDTTAVTDTFWMPEHMVKGMTVVDYIATEVNGEHVHPDDKAVDEFAEVMKWKLRKKRNEGRSGWNDKAAYPQEQLTKDLVNHISKGDPVDVANFCMFRFKRGERINDPL